MNEEKKTRKPRVAKPVTVLIFNQQDPIRAIELNSEDLATYISQNVKGGAVGIKDGIGTLTTGQQFAMFRGTMVSPKVTVKF